MLMLVVGLLFYLSTKSFMVGEVTLIFRTATKRYLQTALMNNSRAMNAVYTYYKTLRYTRKQQTPPGLREP